MDADERPHPFLPVLLAWLVPGAGHLKIGRLWPGVFVFSAIIPMYVGGMALAGFENVGPAHDRHPIYFFAVHVFGGVLTGAAAWLTRNVHVVDQLPDKTTGELFTAVACLLNVVAISDVWSRCSRGDPETRAKNAAAAAAPPEPTPAAPPQSAPPVEATPDAGTPSAEASGG